MNNTIKLGHNMTVQDMNRILNVMNEAFDKGNSLLLSAGDLIKIDGAGLQLLCAIFKEANTQHIDIKWESPSKALVYAANLYGVKEYLKLQVGN